MREAESGLGTNRSGADSMTIGELHRGRFHLDGCFGIGIEGAVDDVSPMNEVGQGSGIEAEALLRDHGDKTAVSLQLYLKLQFSASRIPSAERES